MELIERLEYIEANHPAWIVLGGEYITYSMKAPEITDGPTKVIFNSTVGKD